MLPTAPRRSRSRRPKLCLPLARVHQRCHGTIPAAPPAGGKLGLAQIPPSEKLPDAIGGPVLRAAALKGDPAAAYEIGVRYSEGKGVAVESGRGREMV